MFKFAVTYKDQKFKFAVTYYGNKMSKFTVRITENYSQIRCHLLWKPNVQIRRHQLWIPNLQFRRHLLWKRSVQIFYHQLWRPNLQIRSNLFWNQSVQICSYFMETKISKFAVTNCGNQKSNTKFEIVAEGPRHERLYYLSD